MTALADDAPPRERVVVEAGWRAALAFNSTLPGWLVLDPLRHVTAMHELTAHEAEELGLLLRRSSLALQATTGCDKTYVMLFAEGEGFGHLHVHVVPRMPELPIEARGPRVFAYMSEDEADWIPEGDRDAMALRLRAAFARA
jgi:diadenosine tetraphosphate (Ap4A) HIT family hydrolase